MLGVRFSIEGDFSSNIHLSDCSKKQNQRSFGVMKKSIIRYSYACLAQDGLCNHPKGSYVYLPLWLNTLKTFCDMVGRRHSFSAREYEACAVMSPKHKAQILIGSMGIPKVNHQINQPMTSLLSLHKRVT